MQSVRKVAGTTVALVTFLNAEPGQPHERVRATQEEMAAHYKVERVEESVGLPALRKSV